MKLSNLASMMSRGAGHEDGLTISRFVNEPWPEWAPLLSAHEVARLTRRSRFVLKALALLGRFPRERQFRGRGIGWHAADVQRWMNQSSVTPHLVRGHCRVAMKGLRNHHCCRIAVARPRRRRRSQTQRVQLELLRHALETSDGK